jgi:polyhydroxyalkanoate synthase
MRSVFNAANLQKTFLDAVANFTSNPAKFMHHNLEYAGEIANLMFDLYNANLSNGLTNGQAFWQSTNTDKRFNSESWQNSIYFNFIKQFYLISSKWYKSLVSKLEIPESEKRFLRFYTDSVMNAACPANYPLSNPEVISQMVETNGESLLRGMENFIADLKESGDTFNIARCEIGKFEVGSNIATTKGKVLMQNHLMQLICYQPLEETKSIPMLIIPPWINKYYILDLSEQNSMVRYLVDQGYQVFMVSWVNPDETFADVTFDDYMKYGILEPVEYIRQTFGYQKVSAVGYCLGGTLLTCALAYSKAKGLDMFQSATLITTMIDFSDAGDLEIFINPDTIEDLKHEIERSGYFSGRYMSYVFSLLRANDLIWPFIINNYLLGKKPTAFDMLYWNADSTNLPQKMHIFYLENMYIIKPGGITMLDVPIDVSTIDVPVFFLSAKEDHIAPWQSTYSGAKLIHDANHHNAHHNADITFCLTGSGHVAGVINHPTKGKYDYSVGDIMPSAEEWLKKSSQYRGSWWEYWILWMDQYNGILKPSLEYDKIENFIEYAPGSYVRKRI